MEGIGFLIGILGFLLYKLSKILGEQNDPTAFAEALIAMQQEERKHFVQELHEDIGRSLRLIERQVSASHENSLKNQATIKETLEEIRSIARDLPPSP